MLQRAAAALIVTRQATSVGYGDGIVNLVVADSIHHNNSYKRHSVVQPNVQLVTLVLVIVSLVLLGSTIPTQLYASGKSQTIHKYLLTTSFSQFQLPYSEMIKLQPLKALDEAEAYILTFHSLKLLILGRPDYSSLSHFRPSPALSQSILIQRDNSLYLNTPYRLNLKHFKTVDLSDVTVILICDFKSLLVVPFLLRLNQFTVFLTQPMFELGKVFCQTIIKEVDSQNRFSQVSEFLSQHEGFDLFQQKYGIDIDQFSELYPKNQLSTLLLSCKKLNPGQHHSIGQLILTPYHSGSSIVECIWSIRSSLNNNNVLVVLSASLQQWKHCQPIQVDRLRGRVSHLILGKTLVNTANTDINVCLPQLLASIEKRLRSNQDCTLEFSNTLEIMDFIQFLNYHLGGVFKQLFVLDTSMYKFVKLANSFVQYLNPKKASLIHNDPPEYPFASLQSLINKGLLSFGQMLQIAAKEKVPVKEISLRYKPAIYMYNQEAKYLGVAKDISSHTPLDCRISVSELTEWISRIKPKSIFTYQKGLDIGQSVTSQIELQNYEFTSFKFNAPVNIFRQLRLQGGQIVSSNDKQYILVKRNWTEKVGTYLRELQVDCDLSSSSVQTKFTKVELVQYTFHISSVDVSEAQNMFQLISGLFHRVPWQV